MRNSPKFIPRVTISPKLAEIGRIGPEGPATRRNSPEIRTKFARNPYGIRPNACRLRRHSPKLAEIGRNWPNRVRLGRGPDWDSPKFAEIRRISPKLEIACRGSPKFVRNSPETQSTFDRNWPEIRTKFAEIGTASTVPKLIRRNSPKTMEIVVGPAGNSPKFAEIRTKFVRNSPQFDQGVQRQKSCCRFSPNLPMMPKERMAIRRNSYEIRENSTS